MKKLFFLLFVVSINSVFAQQIIPDGRYTCQSPAWQSADSLVFVFSGSNYEWYINSGKASSGTYSFIDGPSGADTLVLVESPSAACLNNGGQNPIKFSYGYSAFPNPRFILAQTDNSITNCSVHSPHFPGQYDFKSVISGIANEQASNTISLLVTANGIRLQTPGYNGNIKCDIYNLDGQLLQTAKGYSANSFNVELQIQATQTLVAKVTLPDGTFNSFRFIR